MEVIKCGSALKINRCPECGGIWLDKGELSDLNELGEFYIENLDKKNNSGKIKNRIRECPRCSLVLQPVHPPDNKELIVDRCNGCKGLWLDNGELLKLVGK